MNYFTVKTQQRVGEFEFISTSFIKGDFDKDEALRVANENAKFSRSESESDVSESDDGFLSENGQIHTKILGVRLISESAYNEMTSFRDYEKPTTWRNTEAAEVATAQRWNVECGTTVALENEPRYRIETAKISGGQTHVSIIPDVPVTDPAFFNLPQLHIGLEISEGLPVAHIHSSNDELALSIFAGTMGDLYGRPGDGKGIKETPADFMPSIEDVIAQLEEIQSDSKFPGEKG